MGRTSNLILTARTSEVVEMRLPDGQTVRIHLHEVMSKARVRLRFEAPVEVEIDVHREA
jgi:hypothetical protein